jgi:hypothetical protein
MRVVNSKIRGLHYAKHLHGDFKSYAVVHTASNTIVCPAHRDTIFVRDKDFVRIVDAAIAYFEIDWTLPHIELLDTLNNDLRGSPIILHLRRAVEKATRDVANTC